MAVDDPASDIIRRAAHPAVGPAAPTRTAAIQQTGQQATPAHQKENRLRHSAKMAVEDLGSDISQHAAQDVGALRGLIIVIAMHDSLEHMVRF
mmetsp:Transcript_30210/g.53062  ORF Transcript_30210/g.53062 Transcript_30210/m.53062 type:complete len:93 (+) Transcript_30210:163-441(+)